MPFSLAGVEYASADALARALADELGLEAHRRSAGLRWLADVLLAPILLFWGDTRRQRLEAGLVQWQLRGARAGRELLVMLGPDEVRLSIARQGAILWAQAALPLDRQEGLRALHPVGGEAWRAGTAKLEALFATGVTEVRTEPGRLVAMLPLGAFTPARATRVADALARV